jgi:hypothetical protein
VVLVTPQSVASKYCQYEWAILAYRWLMTGKKFLVLPIYSGVTSKQIETEPHGLGAIEAVEYGSASVVAKRIAAYLAKLKVGERPAEQHASFAAELLRNAISKPAIIEAVAAKIELDLGPWDPAEDLWDNFALKLIGVGLDRATIALLEIQQYFDGHLERRDALIQLIACSWVDLYAAGRLGERAVSDIKPRLVGLNAVRVDTARLYVLRACGRAPGFGWPVVEVGNAFSDYNNFRARVESALSSALLASPSSPLQKKLVLREEKKQPVVVILPSAGITKDWLASLRIEFGTATFFLLTGPVLPSAEDLPGALLAPELEPGFEEQFWDNYENNKGLLESR